MQFTSDCVLVTGGAGFIGAHTVARLLGCGLTVRVLDNMSTGTPHALLAHPNLSVFIGDIRDANVVQAAMEGVTHVLHLAAQVSVSVSLSMPIESASHNIQGFLQVIEAARTAGVKRFIYASSAAVYGNPPALPLKESLALHPISPYGLEKQINEQYAALYMAQFGLSCLGLRYFNVYGPWQHSPSANMGVVSLFAQQALARQTITIHGDGEQTRDLIHADDVAEANCRALFSNCTGVINIANGQAVSLLSLLAAFEKQLQYTVPQCFGMRRNGDIQHSYADISHMKHKLEWQPQIPLAEGLAQLLASMSTPLNTEGVRIFV